MGDDDTTRANAGSGLPFPTVSGAALTAACRPRPPVTLPDYCVIPAPSDILVLVPVAQLESRAGELVGPEADALDEGPDKERQIVDAFRRLDGMVRTPIWSAAGTPVVELNRAFRLFGDMPSVRADIAAVLAKDPHTVGSIDTFFNAMLMASRADWRAMPPDIRGAAARGWYIGRWLPTTLMVDGPVYRLLVKSRAFQSVRGDELRYLKAARAFIQDPVVVRFRHALAHWSFEWAVRDDGNHVLCHGHDGELDLHQMQADAIHIITFEIVWALSQGCLRERRAGGASAG